MLGSWPRLTGYKKQEFRDLSPLMGPDNQLGSENSIRATPNDQTQSTRGQAYEDCSGKGILTVQRDGQVLWRGGDAGESGVKTACSRVFHIHFVQTGTQDAGCYGGLISSPQPKTRDGGKEGG